MTFSLRIAGIHYEELRGHLFPGDGREAVAFGLCGRLQEENSEVLTVHEVVPAPHALCTREPDRITWPTDFLAPLLDEAKRKNLGVLKIHSHTSDYARFSSQDDESDRDTFAAIFNWVDTDDSHASAVILPGGQIFGRSIGAQAWRPLDGITVAGDELLYWRPQSGNLGSLPFFERQEQLFGAGTSSRLRGLRVGVVGCSGTGSVVVELLARLGVGTLVLVDDDRIEDRNLNRIVNSKRSDVGRPKVEVLAEAVQAMELGVGTIPLHLNLFTPEAIQAIASCDVVFGCMDTASGRHLLNRLATFYIVPYFDLGVHLASDGKGGIDEASGVVHYLQPGGSSLFSRQAYTLERVHAENLYRTNSGAYAEQRAAGYIQGVDVDRPAVVSVNAFTASLAVNEFLGRLHPFRSCATRETAITRTSFMEVFLGREEETRPCPILRRYVGRGDMNPLLDWPSLSGNEP